MRKVSKKVLPLDVLLPVSLAASMPGGWSSWVRTASALLEWASLPSHAVLIGPGVLPMVIAAGMTYLKIRQPMRGRWAADSNQDAAGERQPSQAGAAECIQPFYQNHPRERPIL